MNDRGDIQVAPVPIEAAPCLSPDKRLISCQEIATIVIGIDEDTWRSWSDQGKTPAPVKLGRLVFWVREEIELWVRWHCPPRDDFEHELHLERSGKEKV